jgi:hypothetical protein
METPPGIRLESVTRFFRESVPGGDAPLRFELISGGRSNLTYRVDMGERSVALRRPPLGHVLPTAHDMRREHRVLSALADSAVPVPRPIAPCEDASVNDYPFRVSTDGVVLQNQIPAGYLEKPADRACEPRAGRTLVALHEVDVAAAGLGLRAARRPRRQLKRGGPVGGESHRALPGVDALLERFARCPRLRHDARARRFRFGNCVTRRPGAWAVVRLGDGDAGDPSPTSATADLLGRARRRARARIEWRWRGHRAPGLLHAQGLSAAHAAARWPRPAQIDSTRCSR